MSDAGTRRPPAAAPQRPFGRPGGGGPGFMGGMGRGPAEKPKDAKKTIGFLLRYFAPRRVRLTIVLVFAVLSTIFTIVGPKLMGLVTTKLFDGLMSKYMSVFLHKPMPSVDFAYIGGTLLLLVGLYLLSTLFSYIQQYQMAGVSQGIVYEMRRDVNDKLARLPLKYFDSKTHGEIMSRVTNDIDNISTTLQQSLTQLITSLCTIVGVLVMMLTISPWLTLIALVTLPVSLLATLNITKRSQKSFGAQQKELGELNGHVEEMYTGHVIVKAFGRERESVEEFRTINSRLFDAAWKAQFISGVIMPMMNFINNIGYVVICVIGGIMAARKALKLGDIQAFIQYSRQFTQPIAQTANIANVLQSTLASAERVLEVLEEAEELPDSPHALRISDPQGQVEFRHVRFGYKEDSILMQDMNITVGKGHTIAIVGPTGAGKTTLVNLLMRFYEISGGSILVDGIDTRELRRGELRRLFGMVLQDTWLFNGTIRENIAYGREGATEDEVVEAAKAAHADHFIRALPGGYDTVLNEEASNISQGEKQLLTIARAILADAPILILDEATSSVDTRTEAYIQKAMQELRQGRTSFVIAHRLSTIRDAESILVMKDGSIIEMGRHDELLAQKGFYADLYNSQFSGACVDEQGV
ncbi:MAG TPA: ABC transporter ATP-binding protein [Rectinemataceae bacterium]|nr:ABC transporter ATP-binding protein [Rectinemataceae bacterium]